MMVLRLAADHSNLDGKYLVNFTHAAYRPDGFPFTFPAEKRSVEIWTTYEETVIDVLNYHYPCRWSEMTAVPISYGLSALEKLDG